jgi:enoyl-CoA hydratase
MITSRFSSFKLVMGEPHVAQLLLASDRRGNPMGTRFWDELPRVFDELSDDAEVRAIVLSSTGKDFSFGLDLTELAPQLMPTLKAGVAGRAEIERIGSRWQRALDHVAGCGKPVIAAVSGWCIGAGLELVAACDFRICSDDARFSLREVRMGVVPDVGGLQRLPFIIGEGWLRQLALTGDDVLAPSALQIGLVNAVLASPELAREAAVAHARRIAMNPPRVVAAIKQVLNSRTEASVQRSLRHALLLNASLMQTDDFVEAVTALMQKRTAIFTGQ